MLQKKTGVAVLLLVSIITQAQKADPYKPDFSIPAPIPGMVLSWNDEFNIGDKPNPANWKYETGFVRNEELQWYQAANANCINGVLLIEGRREKKVNPDYIAGSSNWRTNREFIEYTSSSIKTQGLQQWQYGSFIIRARIDTAMGSWPAIWTLGKNGEWPSNGEVDIMEFYRVNNTPTILANIAWGTDKRYVAKWNSRKTPLNNFTSTDPDWVKKFHTWKMDWDKDSIHLFLDDMLLNTVALLQTINADGSNPFLQPHYLLLNLTIGANGGDPTKSNTPIKYEVDYVRYYRKL